MTDLEQRLAAAEKVCLLYGWSAAHDRTERGKATMQAWMEWVRLTPENFTDPESHPELDDEAIEALADERDATRAETLVGKRFALGAT